VWAVVPKQAANKLFPYIGYPVEPGPAGMAAHSQGTGRGDWI